MWKAAKHININITWKKMSRIVITCSSCQTQRNVKFPNHKMIFTLKRGTTTRMRPLGLTRITMQALDRCRILLRSAPLIRSRLAAMDRWRVVHKIKTKMVSRLISIIRHLETRTSRIYLTPIELSTLGSFQRTRLASKCNIKWILGGISRLLLLTLA